VSGTIGENRIPQFLKKQYLNLYNNLYYIITILFGNNPFYGQTSGPRPPQMFADRPQIGCGTKIGKSSKQKLEKKLMDNFLEKFFENFFVNFFQKFSRKTRSNP
jgi:hypothetical protein